MTGAGRDDGPGLEDALLWAQRGDAEAFPPALPRPGPPAPPPSAPALAIPAEDLATWPDRADTADTGLDAATAGEVLGKRPGAIRTAASRGLRTLNRKLESGEAGLALEGAEAKLRPPARE